MELLSQPLLATKDERAAVAVANALLESPSLDQATRGLFQGKRSEKGIITITYTGTSGLVMFMLADLVEEAGYRVIKSDKSLLCFYA